MESVLIELNKTPGIMGSFVVSSDGMIIASDYTSELDDERLGAIISSIINSTERAISKMQLGKLHGFVLETDQNKIVLQSFNLGFLVVVSHKDSNLGLVRMESRTAVSKIAAISPP
jgi:predicted regulator of Ras-like GTPase activity (Roadblock/LC7/MglB family)